MALARSYAGVVAAAALLALYGCGGAGGGGASPAMPPAMAPGTQTMGTQVAAQSARRLSQVDTDSLAADVDGPDGRSILAGLNKSTIVGSTVDPVTGDLNPYGLDIARSTRGLIHRGDLVVCNFNDAANVQGTGNSIVALNPKPGSSPVPIFHGGALLGCTENVLTSDDAIWATAFVAPDVAVVSPAGMLVDRLSGPPFTAPFGIALATDRDAAGNAVFYESDASDGTVVRVLAGPHGVHGTVIATGFAVNHGVPGTELGPGGLQYKPYCDRLYVVDGANNTLVELRHVSSIPDHGIVVKSNGTSFGGPFAHRGRLVYSGSPLNAPISSALFPNGNIVIGNTGDANGTNNMVEITPHARLAFVRNVDTGAAGAIFGMVSSGEGYDRFSSDKLGSGRDADDVKLYFNDDNDNAVVVLTR